MNTTRTRSLIAISILIATAIAGAIFSGNKTITVDTVLDANYNTLTISGSGSAADPLEVDGNGKIAKCLRITGQYIEVYNLIVDGCASHGVLVSGQHARIENNVIRHTVTENGSGKCSGAGGWGSAVKIGQGSQDVEVVGNTVYENCGEGIAITKAQRVTVSGNTSYDNFSLNLYIDNSNDISAFGNVTYYTSNTNYYRNTNGFPDVGSCIGLGAETYAGWSNRLTNISITNNKLTNCKGVGFWNESGITPINIVIRDNVFDAVRLPWVKVTGAITSNVTATPGAGTPTPTIAPSKTPTRISSPTLTRTLTAVPTISTLPTVTPTPDFMCPLPYTFIQSSEYWLCIFKK